MREEFVLSKQKETVGKKDVGFKEVHCTPQTFHRSTSTVSFGRPDGPNVIKKMKFGTNMKYGR